MDVARLTLKGFVSDRPHDRIGLVVFGEEAFTQAPLTMDQKGLLPFLEQVQIGLAGESATAIGDGIAIAAQRLKSLNAPSKIMIVLTDGQSNRGSEPLEMAQACSELGITIYTIGIGGGRAGLMGMMGLTSGVDKDVLEQISKVTGGKSFFANTSGNLKKVYEEINSLEPSPAEFLEYTVRKEKFEGFALGGILLLLLEWFLSQTILRRLP
jgi:Ca-activated chloride channel family protein